ncbi:MAG: hypothetical protein L0I76_37775, partial [Pseudonocardia sp.]|nr:hypothetical protein [Pseudonocardia sp.]
ADPAHPEPGYQRIADAIEPAFDAADLGVAVWRSGQRIGPGDDEVLALARCLDRAGLIDWAAFDADPARPGDGDTAPRLDPRDMHGVAIGEGVDRGRWYTYCPACSWDAGEQVGKCTEPVVAAQWPDSDVFVPAPSVPPQPTVPRAPVEALLAALAGYHPHDMPADRRRLDALVAELRRHLDTTTNQPEGGT